MSLILVSLWGGMTACNQQVETLSPPSPSIAANNATPIPTPTPHPSSSPPATPSAPNHHPNLISAEGIGNARLGMSFGDFKKQLSPGVKLQVKSPFIVDFDAIAVSQSGEIQYYILYLAGQPLMDHDVIQGL